MPSDVDYLTNAGALRARTQAEATQRARVEILQEGELKVKLPLEAIEPNPYQPRQDFGDVEEFARTLRESGQDYPILVREVMPGRYQVADGETRLRALAHNRKYHPDHPNSVTTVDALVRVYSDEDMALLAFRTAYSRKPLNALEEAQGLKRLVDTFGFSYEALGEKLGKTRDFVNGRLRLLNLPPDIQHRLTGTTNVLTPAHAVVLGGIKDDGARRRLADAAMSYQLPVAEVRRRKELVDAVEAAADALPHNERVKLVEQAVEGVLPPQRLSRLKAVAEEELAPTMPQAHQVTDWDRLRVVWPKLTAAQQHELVAIAQQMSQEMKGRTA